MPATFTAYHPTKNTTAINITLEADEPEDLHKAVMMEPLPSLRGDAEALASVLYIEDNPVNAMVVSQIFASQPQWIFEVASNGAAGIERAISMRPTLILLDMDLGDMTGQQVFSALKTLNFMPPCGCIAMSANAVKENVRSALEMGFTDYWTKPMNIKRMLRRLHLLLPKRKNET